MRKSHNNDLRRYGLLVLAAVLVIGGGVLIYIGAGTFAIHAIGIILIMLGAGAVRLSAVHGQKSLSGEQSESQDGPRHKGPSLLTWIIGGLLLLATGLSYLYLREYALGGGTKAFPVYLFVGVGSFCTLFWAFLIAKLVWRN